MKLWPCAFLLSVLAPAYLVAEDSAPAKPGETANTSALASLVASAAGIDAWPKLTRLRFTWRHVPKDLARTYDWKLKTGDGGEVEVIMPDADKPGEKLDLTLSAKWQAPDGTSETPQKRAHKAFVNDNYWLLFPLHLRWDEHALTDLGAVDVPQLPDLGKRPALAVTYPGQGGYTPGDKYVLYLGEDHLPVAWAFHKAGAADPTLVVRWLDYQTVGGLRLPTRFTTPDGKDFIRIEGLSAE